MRSHVRRGLPWASPWNPIPQAEHLPPAGAQGASCIFSMAGRELVTQSIRLHVSDPHPQPSLPAFQDQPRVPRAC